MTVRLIGIVEQLMLRVEGDSSDGLFYHPVGSAIITPSHLVLLLSSFVLSAFFLHFQGVGRDSPDGKPVNEFEEKIYPTSQEVTMVHQKEQATESWLNNDLYTRRSSSLSSDSLSPKSGRHEVDGTSESPSGKFFQLVENIDREMTTSSSQTDLKDLVTTASQTDLLREIEMLERQISVAEKATITDENIQSDGKNRRRKSGMTESQIPDIRVIEKANKADKEPSSGDSGSGKTSLAVDKERSVTNLWRKKLSVAFKIPDEFESYASETGMALENSVGSKNFVDGVSLRVRCGVFILEVSN